MGRKRKSGVDCFPHKVTASSSPTMLVLQEKYGNDGYVFWFKLLEYLGIQSNLYIDFSDDRTWLYFLSITRVSGDKAENIFKDLAEMNAIDRCLWEQSKVVWIENFTEGVAAQYRKRGIDVPKKPLVAQSGGDSRKAIVTGRKILYAEYVQMDQHEYDSLVKLIGKKAADYCIELLDNYKGSSGKTYKNDYRAIRTWVIDEAKKRNPALFEIEQVELSESDNPFEEYTDE